MDDAELCAADNGDSDGDDLLEIEDIKDSDDVKEDDVK
jgi:hypothetical protein